MRPITFARLFLALAASLCVITGCDPSEKMLLTNISGMPGRSVSATIPPPAKIWPDGNRVLISNAAHKITVERERVLLDGTEIATLRAETKLVDVRISRDGLLSVLADHKEVVTKQLPK